MELPDFIKSIKTTIDLEFKKNLYRNLVMRGGGVRGIAYVGALEVLEEFDIIDNIERVAGTSAGAIGATLLSFRLSMAETKALFDSLDFSQIPRKVEKNKHLPFWEIERAACLERFFARYGWYTSEYFHQWLEGVIAEQCAGDTRATFAQFKERGFRDLYIVATNISRHRAEVFSAEKTPDVAVADAVRMSMSIPLFFEALRFDGQNFGDGDYYVDGGLYDNYPMHIFDQPGFANRSWAYLNNVNWETLGLFLHSPQTEKQEESVQPEDVWEFLHLTLSNVFNAFQIASYQTNPVDSHRTIEISDSGISSVEFDIDPGGEKYNALYEAGQQAAYDFFKIRKS